MGDEGFQAYLDTLRQETQMKQQAYLQKQARNMQMAQQAGSLVGKGIKYFKEANDTKNKYLAIAETVGAFKPDQYAGSTPHEQEINDTLGALDTAQASIEQSTKSEIEKSLKKNSSEQGVNVLSPQYMETLTKAQKNAQRLQKLKETLGQYKTSPEYAQALKAQAAKEFIKSNPVGSPEYYKIMMAYENQQKEQTAQNKTRTSTAKPTEASYPEVNQIQSMIDDIPKSSATDDEKYQVAQELDAVKQQIVENPAKQARAEILAQAQKKYNSIIIPNPLDIEPQKPSPLSNRKTRRAHKAWEVRQAQKKLQTKTTTSATPDADALLSKYKK